MLNNTLISRFSEHCSVSPHSIALELNNESLTYQELDNQSNQLANLLVNTGVKPNNHIPILLNRSFEMIIAILATMKCGATYIPIDPSSPSQRINYILNDLQADFLITEGANELNFAGTTIKADDPQLSIQSCEKIQIQGAHCDICYIIYTSGSTGKPKGVMIGDQAVGHFINSQSEYYGIGNDDRILLFSSFAFDASVEQIFLALTTGASLILIPEEYLIDVKRFTQYVQDKKVTHLDVTPGFLDNLNPDHFNNLKRIVVGGDTCPKSLYLKWQAKGTFYNAYGPTEATVTATLFKCSPHQLSLSSGLPIGKPVNGTGVYILDETKRQVANGVAGEIYLSGEHLAKGYLNNPELTDERFAMIDISGPQRLYKTGDLGRLLANGNIEFLGRIDSQVKIRGYRVELGEIETALSTLPNISQSVVVVKSHDLGDKQLVAFVVAANSFSKEAAEAALSANLPEFMIPKIWVQLNHMPLTVNGKIDRNALEVPDYADLLHTPYAQPKTKLETKIAAIWKQVLDVKRVGLNDNFFDLGGNSLLSQKLMLAMQEQNIVLPIAKLYQYPTIAGLAKYLDKSAEKNTNTKRHQAQAGRNIAVVGLAGRFPGADTVGELWDLLCKGKETTTFFTSGELDVNIPDNIKNDDLYVKARGIINDTMMFDPDFFGINKKLAELMDPQQRIFLEIAFELLEKTGHLQKTDQYKTGVFAGCGPNFYYENNVLAHPEKIEVMGKLQVTTVNDKDYIASRTAYHLNLKGPAINVNSACSTSLLAILEAVNSLRAMQCDVAIAGGASINASINSGHLYQDGSILSKDGHCRPFDNDSTGTVFSDGAGVVLLKRLEDAEADRDQIYAIIKGVGVSNDGNQKASFTAPSTDGQADAILTAIADADVETRNISYIETHGTGTPIGDPIEFEGLLQAFGNHNDKQYCAIGSVKSNFGHLTEAAGVASFIKTCLSLHHKKLLPSIGFQTPNQNIDFKNSPFFVNTKLQDWKHEIKLAGVSSFGVGGTNVHVILEGYQNTEIPTTSRRQYELIAWSAKAPESLTAYHGALQHFTAGQPGLLAEDLAYALNTSRGSFPYRGFQVVSTENRLSEQLSRPDTETHLPTVSSAAAADLVFLFPGQGAQYNNMGHDLYKQEPVYREAVDECAEILKEFMEADIRDVIFDENSFSDTINQTENSQPAIFATGYALARLWMSWGLQPGLLCGHSVGEYVAAHLSGVFSLSDGLKLVALRGKMMSTIPSGGMLSVRVKDNDLSNLLSGELSIAAENTRNLFVVAGPSAELEDFKAKIDTLGIPGKRLSASHAFHSSMMDPVIADFRSLVDTISLSKPKIPVMSTVTGKMLTESEATDPGYWASHLRKTVKFSTAVEAIISSCNPLFLEIGPGETLSVFARQIAMGQSRPYTVISGIKAKESGTRQVTTALGKLWSNGFDINWHQYYSSQQRKLIELPAYTFNKEKYWLEPASTNKVTEHTAQNAYHNMDTLQTRKNTLISRVKTVLENSSGIGFDQVDLNKNFLEIGFDSLLLTQLATSLKREFAISITFRQLNDECSSINTLTEYIAQRIPEEIVQKLAPMPSAPPAASIQTAQGQNGNVLSLLSAQLEIIAKQIQLMNQADVSLLPQPSIPLKETPAAPLHTAATALSSEEETNLRKPFGATPKIDLNHASVDLKQQKFLTSLIQRYNLKTAKSKAYTAESRPYMADPRVVNGFKPAVKDLVYPIVVKQSSGSRLWDLDGNEYIDALNGFGSNMLGYQPECIKEALHDQIEKGFEVGPQHELAAEVSRLVCEFTGFDRTGLCSTGSEAVLGCIRLARTVTSRPIIVAFTGSYHGIFDEVLVRGTKKLKSFPAAAGIMSEAVENILVLDYGTDESLRIIKERANDIAGILVEPIQSRRPDFVPISFLQELREVTRNQGIALIFDEVITGFRMHPGGAQAQLGIKADLAAYGKVVGAGIPIGIIAGDKNYMDALDGGMWNYGDDSIPEIGITYFAGTFVRHPLALAAAKASLLYMKTQGPGLQEKLNDKGNFIAKALKREISARQLPITVVNYGSLWKLTFDQTIPFSELLFVIMREKGIHILDGFPCFLTEATTYQDIDKIITAFTASADEMIRAGFFPDQQQHLNQTYQSSAVVIDGMVPPVPGARLGKDQSGNPAWFIENPQVQNGYLQIQI
ncbi:type I polyketide synthase [Pedobacter sp. BMA]|uniref:type I polyketide synthase n=1 Tax=Pedobacter sp. BMA TaxID=1663685 RepID=UPI00064B04F8|nr:type I polyketide synthase [Pedobacter sp. BMA]KLT66997.1 peptide synthetase [Pedobacter sp. BMA]